MPSQELQFRQLCGLAIATSLCAASYGGQPLETESARVLPKGAMEFAAALEWQTSAEGSESAVPLVFDYGISEHLELSLEPVIYSKISPDGGGTASGLGDFEGTMKWAMLDESEHRPAVALGFELKLPTAKNRQIGTGKSDYRGFAALSRRHGQWDWHANLGYTVLGKPSDLQLNNIFDYAVAVEYRASPQMEWVAEIIGNTAAAKDAGDAAAPTMPDENSLNPEIAGSETVAMIGGRYSWRPGSAFTLGLTYDNNNAFSFRPGIVMRW